MAKQSEATLLLRIKSTGDNILSKTKSALSDLRTWAAAAFAALTSGAAISAFKEAEAATNQLNQSLINNGIYTKELADDYERMAQELQGVSTFEDDAIKAAQAHMQAYLGQTKISKELMQATLDLAAAKKMDLTSAAEMVGKSIGTGTNALARQGIELDKNASKTEKMTKVVDELAKKYGGQAEAATQGLGALDQAKNAFGNLLEVVGERFAPFISAAAQAVTQLSNAIASNKTFLSIFENALQFLAKVIASLKFEFLVVKDVIVAVFSGIYTALQEMFVGNFKKAVDGLASTFSELPIKIGKRWTDVQNEIASIDDIYAKQRRQKQQEEIENTKKAEEENAKIRKKAALDMEEFFRARSEKEISNEITKNSLMGDAQIKHLNEIMKREQGSTAGLQAELKKRKLIDEAFADDELARSNAVMGVVRDLGVKRVTLFKTMLDDMSAMQNSKSKLMVGIGKAAAIANIAINTANAAMGAHAALESIPYVGPGLAIGAAASIVAMGAEKTAQVAGIQLAEGGIVKATPGGVHAIIGEGGRDEAVIPLNDRGGPLMGTTINLTVYGGVLGDAAQTKEFMQTLDLEFFRLRQSNESMAFDRGVI